MTMCQNQSKQVVKVKYRCYGINKFKPTETFPNNKQDIIIHGNEKRTCKLINAAVSGDRYVIKEEVEKIL